MTIHHAPRTFLRPSTCLLAVLGTLSLGCINIGIVPDDIGDSGTEEFGEDDVGESDDEADEAGEDGTTGEEGETGTDGESSSDTTEDGMDDTAGDTTSEETTDEGTTDGTDGDTGTSTETGGSSCEGVEELALDTPEMLSLDGSSEEGTCGGSMAEHIFSFTAPETAEFEFEVTGIDFDPVLYVRSECETGELECAADSVLVVALDAGDSVYVFVDSESDGTMGEITVTQLP